MCELSFKANNKKIYNNNNDDDYINIQIVSLVG